MSRDNVITEKWLDDLVNKEYIEDIIAIITNYVYSQVSGLEPELKEELRKAYEELGIAAMSRDVDKDRAQRIKCDSLKKRLDLLERIKCLIPNCDQGVKILKMNVER